ncbi:MAG: hypothetical protein IKM31_05195 [Oscillospiraceae bacterium]|nr:hypothetical protein [Oscillospiraceae bacterium]
MSQLMYTKKGAVRLPDDPFAHGGEGGVFSVERNPGIVAKIYHDRCRTPQREQKIRAMLMSPPKAGSSVAWPMEALYTDPGCRNFAGFLMPRVENSVKISDFYDRDARRNHSLAFYIRVAQNLCAAVEAVHRCGHVCGDLNPANICVDEKTALVTLVDTDSFHVCQPGDRVFRCTVARPEYVPAEIQRITAMGQDLASCPGPTFTVWTDRFALAVHIFALVMDGCHPYACRISPGYSAGQFGLEKNIAAGRFPFAGTDSRISIPLYAPAFDSLPPALRELARRAFCGGSTASRPSPDDWHKALDAMAGSLTKCAKGHQHWNGVRSCPFCEADKRLRAASAPKKPGLFTPPAARPPVTSPAGHIHIPVNRPPVRTGGAVAAGATVINSKALTPKDRADEFCGFSVAMFFWTLMEFFMLRALYTMAVEWDVPFVAIMLLAVIPWVPVWLIAMWGQKNNYFWQGVRKFCRCTQILAILMCVLVGFWDAGQSGDNWAQGLMYSAIYAVLPVIFSQGLPKLAHKML